MLLLNNKEVLLTKFPAGEVGVNVLHPAKTDNNLFYLKYESDQDLINLMFAVDAVRRFSPKTRIRLRMPYFPYARQDRVCNEGESLAVKVIADFINRMDFDQVVVHNPHSDVLGACLERMTINPEDFWSCRSVVKQNEITHLIAPDAGAEKKVYQLSKQLGLPVIQALKHRDTKTGALSGCSINFGAVLYTGSPNLLVVDDICDGGGTFIMLAQEILKQEPQANLFLYVTHGLFTKGKEELSKYYKGIFNCEY